MLINNCAFLRNSKCCYRIIAEAEAVRAKALAEAEGLDKKAEAMQKMQEAAILQMYFEKLPDIAKAAE